jgi:Universal stress protein family
MSGLGTTRAEGSVHGGSGFGGGAPGRVAVVFERSEAGTAALREAAELANAGRELSVVTLAPQARPARWGRAGGEGPYNIAVREEAELELQEARDILGSVAGRATFKLLAGCPQPPLASWVAQHGFGLVLLPHRRLTPGGNPFARSLRKNTSAEVRLVR